MAEGGEKKERERGREEKERGWRRGSRENERRW